MCPHVLGGEERAGTRAVRSCSGLGAHPELWLSLQGRCHALLFWELGKATSRAGGCRTGADIAIPFHGFTWGSSQPRGMGCSGDR